MSSMKIGEVARLSETPASTIRYYERIGVMPKPARIYGQRLYSLEALEYLDAIRIAKDLGFSLKEIKTLLKVFHSGQKPSQTCRQLAETRLRQLDKLLADAHRMQQILRHGITCQCTSLQGCYLADPK